MASVSLQIKHFVHFSFYYKKRSRRKTDIWRFASCAIIDHAPSRNTSTLFYWIRNHQNTNIKCPYQCKLPSISWKKPRAIAFSTRFKWSDKSLPKYLVKYSMLNCESLTSTPFSVIQGTWPLGERPKKPKSFFFFCSRKFCCFVVLLKENEWI